MLGAKSQVIALYLNFCSFLSRYYFKKVSDEFDCGVVFEEIREEDAILPIFEEKIIGKVEKIDWHVHVEEDRVGKVWSGSVLRMK